MKNCSGIDRANSAADPDWFAQADKLLSELYRTIEEINDPTCTEALDALEDALMQVQGRKSTP